jgi:uncharacterized protein (DUF885 family)
MSGKPSRKGNRTVNDTIKAVHDLLVDQIDNLSAEMDTNTDPVVSKKLLTEMDEMTHRLNIAQNLMFAGTSKTLEGYLPQIKAANDTLANSLKQIQNVAKFMTDATAFLNYVDEALDLAKTLML